MSLGDQLAALLHPVRAQQLGPAEDDRGGALHLIQEELAEVLHIHPALARVHHGGAPPDLDLRVPLLRPLHRRQDLAELADAGGLHQDPIRVIGIDQLIDRPLKIPRQGAADAAGVQLRHGNPRVLHEAAVNSDLPVFVFQQHDLFLPQTARQQLFDQRRFSRSQKTGNYIDFNHTLSSFSPL